MHNDRTLLEIVTDSAKDLAGLAAISLFILAVVHIAIAYAPVVKPV
ncbi:hypothetical protein SAMN05216358_0049 [Rhizobium sp. AN5]|nr:hypothetical protein [Rhizobium sp. AN5]SOC90030.1 hypothetical protein SAMN05216358_0049 [Rhizobium sp. AN5]